MFDSVDALFGNLIDEMGWDDEAIIIHLTSFIIENPGRIEEFQEYISRIANEEREMA